MTKHIPWQAAVCFWLTVTAVSLAEPPLLAKWNCDDGSGAVLSDSSGHGHHGAISGATFVPQGSGFALHLDGRDDYVDCGPGGSGGIGIYGQVTLEAWLKPLLKAHGGSVVMGQDLHTYLLMYYNTEICIWYIGSGANRVDGAQALGEWNHVVAAFDGTSMTVWVNGRQTGTRESLYTELDPTGPFIIGTKAQPSLPRFKGLLDSVRVYDGAMTGEEALAHFRAEAGEHDFDPAWFTDVRVTPYYYLDADEPEVVIEADYLFLQPLDGNGRLTVTLADTDTPGDIILTRLRDPMPSLGTVDVLLPCGGLAAGDYVISVTLEDGHGAFPTESITFSYPPAPSTLPSPAQETVDPLPPPVGPTPFGFTLNNGGGFTLTVNGTDYPFRSRVSWPNGDFNLLNPGAPYDGGEASWSVSATDLGNNRYEVNAAGAHYTIFREMEVFPTHVYVKDTYTNTTAGDLGLLIYNETPVTPGQVTNSLLSGHERYWRQIQVSYPDYCPSVFFTDANTGMGIVPVDDVFVVQAVPYVEWEDAAGVGTETFALAAGASHALEWTVYPTGSKGYYDFVNSFRTVEGRTATIAKAAGFITGTPHVPARRIVPTADWIAKRGLDIGIIHGLAESADDPDLHIEGVEFTDFPQEMALLTQQATDIHAQHPELKTVFHIAPSLYCTDNPDRFADSKVIHSGGTQATWGDGSAFGAAKQAAGWRWWIFYPCPGNSFRTAVLDSVDVMMDAMGFDGGFMDGMFAAYAGLRSYDTGLRWDGHSAEINTVNKTITRKFNSVLLISQSAWIEYARKIRDKGGVVVANNSVMTRSIAEEDYILFDNESASGPELHLAPSATALAYNKGFRSEKHIYLDILDKLSWGELFIHYNDGMNLTHISMASKQYPITFREIRSGMVRGPERIVTMNSGVYGWPGESGLHLVHRFDARGAPAQHDFVTTVDAGVRTFLDFEDDGSAVVVPIPVVLAAGTAVNVRVLQYDGTAVRMLLNGEGSATLYVSDGTFPVEARKAYDVTVGDVKTTLDAAPDDTLLVPPSELTLSGQVPVTINPHDVTLNVRSTPITGVGITGTQAGTTDYTADAPTDSQVALTAPARAADSALATRFGFIATQGPGTGGDMTRIYNPDGTVAKTLDGWGKGMVFDPACNLFVAGTAAIGGKYPIWRYPYLGNADWGPAVKHCEVDILPRALAVDPDSGVLYIGLTDGSPGLSNVMKCTGAGEAPVLFCGVNSSSRQIQDMAVGPDGKLWLGLYAWGYLRFPLAGGFTYELRILNGGKAGGLDFGPDRNGDGKPELYGCVDDTITSFGYYDYETGLKLGTLFSDPDIANYCMTFWPDRNADGVADICVANYADRIRVYDGASGAKLDELAVGLPITYVSGGVPRPYRFVCWTVDGESRPQAQTTVTFSIRDETTAEAVYSLDRGALFAVSLLTGDPKTELPGP